ncbi:MAG: endolytic transglycosylase MltG [Treponema sp.]|nr:endolytic transglycosylase MltG [Candidatus Treponema equifaecale]
MKTLKNFFTILLTLFVGFVAVIVTLFILFQVQLGAVSSKDGGTEVRFEIPTGASVRSVSSALAANGLVKSEYMFYVAARFPILIFRTDRPVMKSGVYSVSTAMNVREIISLFESGKQEYIRTVVPEGLTLKKIASILEEKGVCSAESFISAANDSENLKKFQIPAANFEGFLFPDTYNFAPGMKADAVLSMMVENFFAKIQQIPQFAGKLPSEFYQDLVLASIVEREYRSASEAPLIASVFRNRISDGAGLYSCATIEYIITEILDRPHPDVITYADLKIDSPYNTYKWAGLTPGPISNPGMVALNAAADTPKTNYRFFVLKGDGSGTHNFTRSQSEHEKAIIQYRTKKAAGSN